MFFKKKFKSTIIMFIVCFFYRCCRRRKRDQSHPVSSRGWRKVGCGQLLSSSLPEKYRQLEGCGQSHECYFILMKNNFIIDLRISKMTLMP